MFDSSRCVTRQPSPSGCTSYRTLIPTPTTTSSSKTLSETSTAMLFPWTPKPSMRALPETMSPSATRLLPSVAMISGCQAGHAVESRTWDIIDSTEQRAGAVRSMMNERELDTRSVYEDEEIRTALTSRQDHKEEVVMPRLFSIKPTLTMRGRKF